MALEDLLTKLIVSIDANTAAIRTVGGGGGAVGAVGAATTGKPVKADLKAATNKAASEIDFDAVKASAGKVLDKMGKAFTKKLIKDVGGSNELATVKPEKYGALMAAFQATLDKPDEEEEEDDEL